MTNLEIAELVKNKAELIAIKKIAIKHTDCVLNFSKDNDFADKDVVLKGHDGLQKVIANTYYWLDSHGDVHIKGCFTKSIKENKTKIFHLDNHNSENGFRSKVGNVKDIIEKQVNWRNLNIDKDGNTIVVIGISEVLQDYNKQVFDAYKNNEIDQHSVGMIYVDIDLAVNSAEYPEEFKNWNDNFSLLGNPEKATERGSFWIIKQAKLKEYSCVLWDGSNALTPAIKNNNQAEDNSLDKTEPSEDTQNIPAETQKRKKVLI